MFCKRFLAALLLWSTVAYAGPVAYDTITPTNGSGTSISFSHAGAITATAVLAAICINGTSPTFSSVTYGGVTMTLLDTLSITNTLATKMSVYYLPRPLSGTQTFAATISSSSNWTAGVVTFIGADNVVPYRGTNKATAAGSGSNVPTVTITSAATDVAVDAACNNAITAALTVDASQTQRMNQGQGTNQKLAVSTEPGAASVTMDWDSSGATAALGTIATSVQPERGSGSSSAQ